jgi:hypothetical protein
MFRRNLLFVFALASAMIGCATTDTTAITEDEALQQTMLPKHADFDNPGLLQSLLTGNRKENEKKAEEAEARIARLEQALQQEQLARETRQQPVAAPLQLRSGQLLEKVGLVFAADIAAPLQDQVEQALLASGTDFPVAVASTAELDKQLAAYDCAPFRLDGCGERLVVYPGVHYLAEISRLQVLANQAVAEVRLHDLAYGVKHAAIVVELPAVNGELSQRVLRGLTDKIMTDVLTAARATPWSTRAFDHEGGEIFLAAGERSGLQPGMVLAVHGKGRLVRSPSGGVAGWIPGPKKGELKVTGLFGDDYAIAELTDGEPPTPDDPVLKL